MTGSEARSSMYPCVRNARFTLQQTASPEPATFLLNGVSAPNFSSRYTGFDAHPASTTATAKRLAYRTGTKGASIFYARGALGSACLQLPRREQRLRQDRRAVLGPVSIL